MTDVDHFYLDRPTIRTLSSWLADFEWIGPELDTVLTRQTQYTSRSERPTTDTAVPFHARASKVHADLRGTLLSWMANVCDTRHLPRPHPRQWTVAGLAQWIRRNVYDLAQLDAAPDAFDEFRELRRRAIRVVDRPQDWEFVGKCQSDVDGIRCHGVYAPRGADTRTCPDCAVCIDIPTVMAATRSEVENRLYNARELATALTIVTGSKVPFERVRNWIRRGKLTPVSVVGPALYRLDHARELANPPERKRPA